MIDVWIQKKPEMAHGQRIARRKNEQTSSMIENQGTDSDCDDVCMKQTSSRTETPPTKEDNGCSHDDQIFC